MQVMCIIYDVVVVWHGKIEIAMKFIFVCHRLLEIAQMRVIFLLRNINTHTHKKQRMEKQKLYHRRFIVESISAIAKRIFVCLMFVSLTVRDKPSTQRERVMPNSCFKANVVEIYALELEKQLEEWEFSFASVRVWVRRKSCSTAESVENHAPVSIWCGLQTRRLLYISMFKWFDARCERNRFTVCHFSDMAM